MNRLKTAFFLCLFQIVLLNSAHSQFILHNSDINMGDLKLHQSGFVDVMIENTGNQKFYILRTDAPREVQVLYSSKLIEPGSTEYVRLKPVPLKQGKFDYDIKLFLSLTNDVQRIQLKGSLSHSPDQIDPSCPDFSTSKGGGLGQIVFEQKFMIYDSEGNPIDESYVHIWHQGVKQIPLESRGRKSAFNLIPGSFYITVEADEFQSVDTSLYINKNTGQLYFHLEKDENLQSITSNLKVDSQKTFLDSEIFNKELENEESELTTDINHEQTTTIMPIEPELSGSSNLLSMNEFKPNNLVFLLDISSSMAKRGKLDLVKVSFFEMLEKLRSVDKIGVVTYSGAADILINGISADQKEEITKFIKPLCGEGLTSGGSGIREAYSLINESYIPGGNNEIILMTDGEFNVKEGERGLPELIKRETKKGIRLSVIGIMNGEITYESLQYLVKIGEGNYIKVRSMEEAKQVLLNEVMRSSAK